MKNRIILLIIFMSLLVGCGKVEAPKLTKTNLIVPTTLDQIGADALWTPTFQLVWNDLKNEVVKSDIAINHEYAVNLNKETFKETDLNPDYFYKKYGEATLDLKKEIEGALLEKFNQKSAILDQFNWNGGLIFYTMLYREFKFSQKFDTLSNNDFNIYKDVEYFGFKKDAKVELRNQVKILFYENDQNFAISLKTKNNDEIIMYKNPTGSTFSQIIEVLNTKVNEYKGTNYLTAKDEFKAPKISFNYLKEYEELENKPFLTSDGAEMFIDKGLQTIEFTLNEKGGKVKSEAGISVKNASISLETPKKLYLNDTFALFIKEEGKDNPYFAAKITDITKFQTK